MSAIAIKPDIGVRKLWKSLSPAPFFLDSFLPIAGGQGERIQPFRRECYRVESGSLYEIYSDPNDTVYPISLDPFHVATYYI